MAASQFIGIMTIPDVIFNF